MESSLNVIGKVISKDWTASEVRRHTGRFLSASSMRKFIEVIVSATGRQESNFPVSLRAELLKLLHHTTISDWEETPYISLPLARQNRDLACSFFMVVYCHQIRHSFDALVEQFSFDRETDDEYVKIEEFCRKYLRKFLGCTGWKQLVRLSSKFDKNALALKDLWTTPPVAEQLAILTQLFKEVFSDHIKYIQKLEQQYEAQYLAQIIKRDEMSEDERNQFGIDFEEILAQGLLPVDITFTVIESHNLDTEPDNENCSTSSSPTDTTASSVNAHALNKPCLSFTVSPASEEDF